MHRGLPTSEGLGIGGESQDQPQETGSSSSEEAGSLILLHRAAERAPVPGGTGPLRSQGVILFCDAFQLITVYSLPGMDPDWLIGERGNKKGKVPVTYLELLS